MPSYGFVIDNRKCIGCHACTVACKSEHQVPLGVDRTWVKYVEKGTFPNTRRLFTVMRCNHCDAAPCVTICPVTSLYRRDDGVIDFNPDRCIGCKACLQACPYDALYIDPETSTAAKCNFCTHRLEVGLEPSCVVVCPEQAIIAGDLSDPQSEIAQLVDRHPVQVRKPEKGTRPKLFYIEGDAAALVPTRTAPAEEYVWASSRISLPMVDGLAVEGETPKPGEPRRVYDVRPRPPHWGWQVVGYTWTKAISTGATLASILSYWFASGGEAVGQAIELAIVALLFLAITGGLLIADLKQPRRFLYVLLRPQWRSWLVRGAYVLLVYGLLLGLWCVSLLLGRHLWAGWLATPLVLMALLAAVYTAFLLAQGKGRDFWQNPLLSIHLLAHAVLAGSALWLFTSGRHSVPTWDLRRWLAVAAIGFSGLTLLAEAMTVPPTDDARRASDIIFTGEMRLWFWAVGVGVGLVIPLLLIPLLTPVTDGLAVAAMLFGLYGVERLWIVVPQRIPLS